MEQSPNCRQTVIITARVLSPPHSTFVPAHFRVTAAIRRLCIIITEIELMAPYINTVIDRLIKEALQGYNPVKCHAEPYKNSRSRACRCLPTGYISRTCRYRNFGARLVIIGSTIANGLSKSFHYIRKKFVNIIVPHCTKLGSRL
jgi:hypothetical protein